MARHGIRDPNRADRAVDRERAFQKRKGMENVRVSFSEGCILMDEEDPEKPKKIFSSIEPRAKIVSSEAATKSKQDVPNKVWPVPRIPITGILSIVRKVYIRRLHGAPYSRAEYYVLLLAYSLIGDIGSAF